MVIMFEDAYKQQPNNEELGAETFFATVRATNWKAAQQVNSFLIKPVACRSSYVANRSQPRCINNSRILDTYTGP